MKVLCFFHRGFQTFPRGYKQIETLAAEHDVTVLCTDRGDLPRTEKHGDARIQRKPIAWPDISLFKPVAILYVLLLLLWSSRHHRDADIVHCFGMYSLFPGLVFKWINGAYLTYDAFEDFPYQIERSNALGRLSEMIVPFVVRIELFLIRRTNHVFTVPSVDDRLETRFSQATSNITTIKNVPRASEGDLPAPETCPEYDPSATNILYIGGLQEDKGSIQMAKSIARASKITDQRLNVLLVGPFTDDTRDSIKQIIADADLGDRVHLPGFVPYEKVYPYLVAADISLQLYQDTPWNRRSTGSSTLFRYMAASLPVIVSDLPGIGGIVETNDCGIVVPPTDVTASADAIVRLATDTELRHSLGDNGSKAFRTDLNWNVEKQKFLRGFQLSDVK